MFGIPGRIPIPASIAPYISWMPGFDYEMPVGMKTLWPPTDLPTGTKELSPQGGLPLYAQSIPDVAGHYMPAPIEGYEPVPGGKVKGILGGIINTNTLNRNRIPIPSSVTPYVSWMPGFSYQENLPAPIGQSKLLSSFNPTKLSEGILGKRASGPGGPTYITPRFNPGNLQLLGENSPYTQATPAPTPTGYAPAPVAPYEPVPGGKEKGLNRWEVAAMVAAGVLPGVMGALQRPTRFAPPEARATVVGGGNQLQVPAGLRFARR